MDKCLILDASAPRIPEPHPTFLGGRAYVCYRCGKEFSESSPTAMSTGCPFDSTVHITKDLQVIYDD